MGTPVNWGRWKLIRSSLPWSPAGLSETLLGGQAFRWWMIGQNHYCGTWGECLVEIRLTDKHEDVQVRWPSDAPTDAGQAIARYLGLDEPWPSRLEQLPWRSDPVIAQAIQGFPGLRLLRQPLSETLLAFLCSSNKRIIQIRQMCEALAASQGRQLTAGFPLCALPTWEKLAETSESSLLQCKLGYRARYIHAVAHFLAENPGWLDSIPGYPLPEARQRLMVLPGVGQKVADCVLLFGAGFLEAFPIDTWIEKILCQAYGLGGWSRTQFQDFARIHFGPCAGLAQQYLFALARAGERKIQSGNRLPWSNPSAGS